MPAEEGCEHGAGLHRVPKVSSSTRVLIRHRNKSSTSLKQFKEMEKIGVSREKIIQEFLPVDYAK